VALLRHPVDRAYSQYMLHVNAGRAPYRTFETHFREALPHRAAWTSMPYDCYGLARSFYYEGLKRYFDCFPREQIRVYRTEDLTAHPASLLADLYGFLGVDATFQPDLARRSNVGGGLPRNRLLHQLVVGKNGLKDPVKRVVPAAWWHRLNRFLLRQTRTPKRTLPPEIRAAFFEVYRDDVLQTQALTGLDLRAWFPSTP